MRQLSAQITEALGRKNELEAQRVFPQSESAPDKKKTPPVGKKRRVSRYSRPNPGADLPDAFVRFDTLPDAGWVDQATIEWLIGCSSATIWRRVHSGLLPKPKKFGRSTRWNVGAIRLAMNPPPDRGVIS